MATLSFISTPDMELMRLRQIALHCLQLAVGVADAAQLDSKIDGTQHGIPNDIPKNAVP